MITKLERVQNIAKKLGVKEEIKLSSNKQKKFMLITSQGQKIHFGQRGYQDYLDHKDETRRTRFHQRFRSNVNYNKPNTAMWLARRLLW